MAVGWLPLDIMLASLELHWVWRFGPTKSPGRQELGTFSPYPNEIAPIEHVKAVIASGGQYRQFKSYRKTLNLSPVENLGRQPRVLVIGSLGRCGKCAVDLCLKAGLADEDVLQWDMAETARGGGDSVGTLLTGGGSQHIHQCMYLLHKIPIFVDTQSLASPSRQLSVVVDVSCDTTNPNNLIPIYNENTTFTNPTLDQGKNNQD